MLPDAGRIQEEDAANANRHGYSKHEPGAAAVHRGRRVPRVSLLQPVGYDRPMPVADGVEVEFINAGHLLGSAYARVRVGGTTILFGGDLGRFGRPVLPDPTMVDGSRRPARRIDLRRPGARAGRRRRAAGRGRSATAERGGKVIIPAFAIGRVEELLYWLKRLEEEKRIPVLPVFVDSPMAAEALARYTERVRELDPELQPEERDEKAPHGHGARTNSRAERREQARQERQLCAFCTERFRTIASPQESRS